MPVIGALDIYDRTFNIFCKFNLHINIYFMFFLSNYSPSLFLSLFYSPPPLTHTFRILSTPKRTFRLLAGFNHCLPLFNFLLLLRHGLVFYFSYSLRSSFKPLLLDDFTVMLMLLLTSSFLFHICNLTRRPCQKL